VLATIYVDVFRGVPTILVIFLLGFGVPALRLQGVPTSPVFWGTTALILSYSAYVAEVFRAGIGSVHPSQRMAARSLGLSMYQTNRYVVLPQAVRNVVPPLLNDFISLQKDTALVSVLGPIEVLRQAQIDASSTFNYTAYVAAALIFIALTIPMTRFADWVQGRMARRQRAGAVA
jgi:polar amino acid transport system permease protein